MRAYILTNPSLVDLLIIELGEYTKNIEKTDRGAIVEGDFNLFYNIILNSHLVEEVLLFIGNFIHGDYSIFENIKNKFKIKNKTMRITSNQEILYNESPGILNTLKLKVDLSNPFYDFYIFKDKGYYSCGIRLFPNISKRDYKIHPHRISLNPLIAFSLFYPYKGNLLDPFSRDGTIAIERSLYKNRMLRKYRREQIIEYSKRFVNSLIPYYYDNKNKVRENIGEIYASTDNLSDLKKSKMNSKIAGINDIKFSRYSIDQLDYRFDKNSISIISTIPNMMSKNNSSGKIKNQFFLLLKQAAYILNEEGILSMILNSRTIELLNSKNIKYEKKKLNNSLYIIKIMKKDL